ncbi:MAG: tetratricopeptide repeat protein, partial [Streptococcus sp.]|nr:tetratricopeptide repeat protein [Streptococcus sp.]
IYAKESDDVVNHACICRGLGEIAQALGNLKEARTNFAAAIRLFDQAGDAIGKAEVEELLASCP